MKWSVSSTLGRNLDVLAEEESEEEEVDDGQKREVSHNVTLHAGMKRSGFQFFFQMLCFPQNLTYKIYQLDGTEKIL